MQHGQDIEKSALNAIQYKVLGLPGASGCLYLDLALPAVAKVPFMSLLLARITVALAACAKKLD